MLGFKHGFGVLRRLALSLRLPAARNISSFPQDPEIPILCVSEAYTWQSIQIMIPLAMVVYSEGTRKP